MISASHLLHAHVGAPAVDGCGPVEALCWVCGAPCSRGMPRSRWMGANFTGQNRVRAPSSSTVCEPCVWAMAGRPPDTLRMYSHLYEEGVEYLHVNKGDKPAMRAFLRRSHASRWFAAIADSGQKHIVPWTPINPPGSRGRVLFEESIVHLPDAAGWELVDEMAALLTAGATKEEMATARYGARAWQLCGPGLRRFEAERGGARGGPWFELALWLAQRDEVAVAARMAAEKEAKSGKAQRRRDGAAADAHGGDALVRAGGVSRDTGLLAAEALGPAPEQNALGGAPRDEPGRVGDDVVPVAPAARPVQLGLPGFG